MNREEHQNSTAWWGTCDECSTTVIVYRHPEADSDIPPLSDWENGGIYSRCYVCDADVQWGGSDVVKEVRL